MPDSLDREQVAASAAIDPREPLEPAPTDRRTDVATRVRTLLHSEGGPLIFVWSTWLVMSWLLYAFVREHGTNIPRLDEWEMVPALTGEQPITLSWLWSQHNEHRILLPRLIYLAVTKLSGTDFRAGMWFDVLVLSAVTAALTLTARALRGKTTYSDAFFALLLLHYGQVENLLWSFQIQFVCGSALIIAALCALAQPGPVRERSAICVGLCALMLPLFGGNGLALVPALALCALSLAWQLRQASAARRTWLLVGGLGVGSIALTGLYFVGYNRPAGHPISPSLEATLTATQQILSYGLGSGMRVAWPEDRHLVPGLVALTLIALVYRFVRAGSARGHEERFRIVRFGLVIGGMLTLTAGIAWARAGVLTGGVFASRYATLVAPLLCALYLSWQLTLRPQLTRLAQVTLFSLLAIMLLRNRDMGLSEASYLQSSREAALVDVIQGVPLTEVARRHCGTLYLCDNPALAERMRLLRDKKIGEFANANPE